MADRMRSRVEATVVGREWAVRLGPGLVVDLDSEVAPGVQLGDCVDRSWFEPVEPVAAVDSPTSEE